MAVVYDDGLLHEDAKHLPLSFPVSLLSSGMPPCTNAHSSMIHIRVSL